MSNLDKLAKLLSGNNNNFNVNIAVGEVISTSPIKIKYGENIVLETRHLVVSDSFINGYTGQYTDDNGTNIVTKTISVKKEINTGDKVILIPDQNLKKWYLIDKVG